MADHMTAGKTDAGKTDPGKTDLGKTDLGKADLREADVLAYLRRNPRVLLNNPDLLSALAPDTRFETEEVVVDMQRFVVDRLRRQVDEMKAASDRLVTTTRSNMSLVERTMECALALLYARDYNELAQILHDDLPVHLGVDAISIGFETNSLPIEAAHIVKALPQGTVDQLVGPESTRIRPDTQGEAAIYGSAAGLVRSDALVALPEGEGLPAGLFAVGCRAANHFENGQGTELIAFLAHVSRYAVGRWWTLKL
ncbi:MAG: DUF484 family protein [Rhodospirillaceae bacterium]